MRRLTAWVTLSLSIGVCTAPAAAATPADEPPFMPKTLAGALTAARNITCYDCVEVVRWDYVNGKRVLAASHIHVPALYLGLVLFQDNRTGPCCSGLVARQVPISRGIFVRIAEIGLSCEDVQF